MSLASSNVAQSPIFADSSTNSRLKSTTKRRALHNSDFFLSGSLTYEQQLISEAAHFELCEFILSHVELADNMSASPNSVCCSSTTPLTSQQHAFINGPLPNSSPTVLPDHFQSIAANSLRSPPPPPNHSDCLHLPPNQPLSLSFKWPLHSSAASAFALSLLTKEHSLTLASAINRLCDFDWAYPMRSPLQVDLWSSLDQGSFLPVQQLPRLSSVSSMSVEPCQCSPSIHLPVSYDLLTQPPLTAKAKRKEILVSQNNRCAGCGSYIATFEASSHNLSRLPRHWFQSPSLWSMTDLSLVEPGAASDETSLSLQMRAVLDPLATHIMSCARCRLQGFVCEDCHTGDILFPFGQPSTTTVCPICLACFHKACRPRAPQYDSCPRCCRRFRHLACDVD